jgi:ABC-type Mn2+/Zn2+ transport system ATPase subunit
MGLFGLLVGIIGLVLGVPGIIIGWPAFKNWVKSRSAKHVLVLFGPPGAGKTTLAKYLRGEPLPRQHIPTHSYERSGKIIYDLSGNKTFFFTMKEVVDMGGEFVGQLKPI